jgi:hypothetical protein
VNIFVLDADPYTSARMMCDKHIPKMVVESAQMLASAMRSWGATDEQFIAHGILTKAGKPYKGGYANHPCTVWAGESYGNFAWLHDHAMGLLVEYTHRFGKEHACRTPIIQLRQLAVRIKPSTGWAKTPFALAMPDEYRPTRGLLTPEQINNGDFTVYHALDDDAVQAYRRYYHSKSFARWEKGTPAPDWWQGTLVEVKI